VTAGIDNIKGDKRSPSISNTAVRTALRSYSGRIAHDFNNMLTMLMAYPQLIRRDLDENSQGYELLGVLEDNAERMAGVAERLAKFSAGAATTDVKCDPDGVIRNVLTSIEGDAVSAGIRIASELNAGREVPLSKAALAAVVEELVRNGCESMSCGGSLRVVTDSVSFARPFASLGGRGGKGTYVRIRIIDSGEGVQPEYLERIIEPFFTLNKRNKARGAGLGLSIVYTILCDCGGCLQAERIEDGFAVTVLLPLRSDCAPAEDSEPAAGGSCRILVVDDEDDISRLFQLMLGAEIAGSTVDAVADGTEAVAAFERNPYDVIVMDLHMPEMDGQTAFIRIRELCERRNMPMPPVVFCTGYVPPNGITEAVEGDGRFSLLLKPVDMRSLVDSVKVSLAQK